MVLRAASLLLAAAFVVGLSCRAGAQGSGGACRFHADRAGLFEAPVITVTMRLPPGLPGSVLVPCRFDLRALTSGRPVTPRLSAFIPDATTTLEREHLSVAPGHGTLERFDNIVSYTPEQGFVGVDSFSIDFTGRGAHGLRTSTLNFVFADD